MKGLKVIPIFLILIVLSYFGLLFVEANREEVVIHFFSYQSPPTPLGFVVLTSALVGMIFSGLLCTIEILALYVQNKNLKRKWFKNRIEPEKKSGESSLPVEI